MNDDTDTGRAVAAVARILRTPPSTDPEITAAHIVTSLRGHGWRPTAIVEPPWHPPAPLAEERVHAIAAQAREAITRPPPEGPADVT